MAATTATKKNNNNNVNKIKELEKQIQERDDKYSELEKQFANLNNMFSAFMQQSSMINNVDSDRDVMFISLCNHILNLSTEPNGAGNVYTFTEFGEEQSIPYSEARKIIKNNRSFIKGGKCYIADDKIVEAEHLGNDYKKILNKDSLLELLSEDREGFKNMFDNMTQMQKEIFRDIIIDKLTEDRYSVDMNIVQYVNEVLGIDMLKSIDLNKGLMSVEE